MLFGPILGRPPLLTTRSTSGGGSEARYSLPAVVLGEADPLADLDADARKGAARDRLEQNHVTLVAQRQIDRLTGGGGQTRA